MPALEDFYRPLSPRGLRNAFSMGDELRERGIFPDLIVSSPAVRAINTAIIIARKIDFPQQRIQSNDRIYEASVDDLLKVIGNVSDSLDHLMLFGHNPSLTNLINHLQPELLDNLPTCGVFSIELAIDSWTEMHDAKGRKLFTILARELGNS